MTNIEKIEASPTLQIELSRLLNKELKIVDCWHERIDEVRALYHNSECSKCGLLYTINPNPNLFSRSAFLDVFDAVKDREDFKLYFIDYPDWMDKIDISLIDSPAFQLAVLKWLLEKDGRLGELEEVMKGEGE